MMMVKGIIGGDEFLTEVLIRGLTFNGVAEGYCVGNFDEVIGMRLENKYGVHYLKKFEDFVSSSIILFLTFEPTETEKILPRLAEKINEESLIVSVVSDLKLKKLEETFPNNPVIRLYITPSIISGQGLGAYIMSKNASIDAKSVAHTILNSCGDVVNIDDENELETLAHYLTSNTYMSYVIIQNMLKLAKKSGIPPKDAAFIVDKLFKGAVHTLIESDKDTASLIRRGTLDQRFRTKVTKLIETQGIRTELEKFIQRPVYAELIEAEEEEKMEHGTGSAGHRFTSGSSNAPATGFAKKIKTDTKNKKPKIQMHYRKDNES